MSIDLGAARGDSRFHVAYKYNGCIQKFHIYSNMFVQKPPKCTGRYSADREPICKDQKEVGEQNRRFKAENNGRLIEVSVGFPLLLLDVYSLKPCHVPSLKSRLYFICGSGGLED